MPRPPMTAVEAPSFLRDAASLMTDEERGELVAYVATNPEAGVVMPGTGGVRKIRWAGRGRGKRGGIRVIYYFCGEALPVFLLNAFAKNEKVDLSQAEKNEMKKWIPRLVAAYGKRSPR
jgi:hypothetical protein